MDDIFGNLNGITNKVSDDNVTCDTFTTEEAAEEWIHEFLISTKRFSVYPQTMGVPIFRHHNQDWKDVRCDLLAIPLGASGVDVGVLVVEVKRSGIKIGPGISQIMDYLHSVFQVRNSIGVIPTIGFLFPCNKQHGAVASWMQHQHIGTANRNWKNGLVFFVGEQRVLEFDSSGNLEFYSPLKSGKKMGAR
jgi:hypothetical protein